jgi:hypothetical protein
MDATQILKQHAELIESAKQQQCSGLVLRQMAERIVYEMVEVPNALRFIPDLTDLCLRSERQANR